MQTKNRPITAEELKEIKRKYNKDIFIIINGEYYLLKASEPDPITAKIENAKRIIHEYNERHPFNPYTIITGGETQEQKLYTAAVEFFGKVEAAAEEMNEKTTYKINLF